MIVRTGVPGARYCNDAVYNKQQMKAAFPANRNRRLHIAFDQVYAHPLPEGHRFPMLKYELIPEQLLYEGAITTDELYSPGVCKDETALLTHTAD